MALVYWAGRKWKLLRFLTRSRNRWLVIWGCFGFLEAVALAGLVAVRGFSSFVIPIFPGWAARATWSALDAFHLNDVRLHIVFLLGFSIEAIGQTTIGVVFAALVWWICGSHPQFADMPRPITPIQRYVISAMFSACVLGIANHIYSMRPPTCYDCFAPDGIPFTYFHEGGFAGGEGFVWSGVIGDALVVLAIEVIIGWAWNRRSQSHSIPRSARL